MQDNSNIDGYYFLTTNGEKLTYVVDDDNGKGQIVQTAYTMYSYINDIDNNSPHVDIYTYKSSDWFNLFVFFSPTIKEYYFYIPENGISN